MDELTEDVGSTGNMNRREALRRGAFVVGAATLWTTPVVQTLGMRPASAQTSPTGDSDFCEEVGSSGQPNDLVFRFEPRACDDSGIENGQGDTDYTCSGDVAPTSPACITIQRTGGPSSGTISGSVEAGSTFLVPGKAGATMTVTIDDGETVQTFSFHTSCSQPLDLNDEFGSLTLVGGQVTGEAAQGVSGEPLGTTSCL